MDIAGQGQGRFVIIHTWVSASVEGDVLAVHLKTILAALNATLVRAMDSVVLEHVCSILRVAERVVDGYDLDIWVLHSSTQDKPADAAEAIDANFDRVSLSHGESVIHLSQSVGPLCTVD